MSKTSISTLLTIVILSIFTLPLSLSLSLPLPQSQSPSLSSNIEFNKIHTINQSSSTSYTISLPDGHHFSLIILLRKASSDLSYKVSDGKYINIENKGNIDFRTEDELERLTLSFIITSSSAFEIDFIISSATKTDFIQNLIDKKTIPSISMTEFKGFSYFFLNSHSIYMNKLQLKLDFNQYNLYIQSDNGRFEKISISNTDIYELDESSLIQRDDTIIYVLIFENKAEDKSKDYVFTYLLKGIYKEIHNSNEFIDNSLFDTYENVNIKLNYSQKKQIVIVPPSSQSKEAKDFVVKVDLTKNNDFSNGYQSIVGFKRIVVNTDESVFIKCKLLVVDQTVKIILNIKEI